ncbi:TetR/AcrR family transcriptional regulator [Geodermatophilus sp. DSM 44513]|uniref:TetR/AcrR family transcriptional regulator n=1 Tax=Geodermatophilus sp. DSM 44513 TaxID=1528104 RepID=UPI0014137556|nr:TetR/AcrR family transcriptional regulator [Geodermatophilus sp. DSM 44513]WNV77042.1 TetR/AcrR family transcriptional regulator [Geodermatophilus sp. DSM 44513]
MSHPTRTAYRHGDLPAALVAAGTELARLGGPQAVVLREATRRVGVSPNAAYRHFADHRALLRAVCAVAMAQLACSMEAEQAAVPPADPQEMARLRLRAVGAGYLRYAREQPGLFRTAFAAADELTDEHDARGASGLTPFQLLNAALDELVEAGLLAAERRPDAEMTAWSAVHGLSMLLLEGPLRGLDEEHADRVGRQLLDHVEAGLLAPLPADGRSGTRVAGDPR